MKKIIAATCGALLVSAGILMATSNQSKPVNLLKSNIEASSVKAFQTTCETDLFSCPLTPQPNGIQFTW